MAKEQSHFSFSIGLAVLYILAGILLLSIRPEILFLAAVLVVVAGMLPNIDEGGSGSAQEFGGMLAAVSPLVFLQFFPRVQAGGVSRIALVVICCYLISRVIIARILQNVLKHRGSIHSVPAAIVSFECVYLLFWDLPVRERIFLALAAFMGFFMHLVMDAYSNLDLVGRAMGKGVQKQPGALKLTGASIPSTIALYTCMTVLGWYVIKDIYPGFHFVAGVKY